MGRDLFVTDLGQGPSVLAIHGQPGLGSDWEILKSHFKIYAQDGFNQPITEGLERIRKAHSFKERQGKQRRLHRRQHQDS